MERKVRINEYGRLVGLSLICGASLLVMTGHILDINWVTKVDYRFVTMKFATAFMFFVSGVALLSRDSHLFVVLATLVGAVIASMINCGAECIFPQFDDSIFQSVVTGFPSYATLLCFGLISLYPFRGMRSHVGHFLVTISGIALVGYILKAPVLFYYVEAYSTAMAIHTAIFFLIIGGIIVNEKLEK